MNRPLVEKVRRVAIVLSELRPGGMERVVVHLARGLAEAGISPLVICLQGEGKLASQLTCGDIPLVALNSTRGYDVRAIFKLAKILGRFNPSIVNVHDYSSLPYVALAEGFRSRWPIVFTAHGLLYHGFEKTRLRYKWASKRLAALTAVSEKVAARHVEHLSWTKPVHVLPNGAARISPDPNDRIRIREELGISAEIPVFLAVGNARPEKAFENLLDAAAIVRDSSSTGDFCVLVAGGMTDCPYCAELLRKREQLNLTETVRFLGFRSDVEALYSAADVFVLSSRSEGLPMVILEAMMAGLPIVATRVGGVPSVVHEDVGMLVDAAAPEQLARAMASLAGDSDLRAKMGVCAREYALAEHSVERMVSLYVETFNRILARKAKKSRERTP